MRTEPEAPAGLDGPAPPSSAPRLNPFAFPSDTDLRFLLLIMALAGASMFVYQVLFHRYSADAGTYAARATGCLSATQGVTDPFTRNAAVSACLAPVNHATALWLLGGLAPLFGLAALLYWYWPALKLLYARKRLGEEPRTVGDEEYPGVPAALAELYREAGLDTPPMVLTNDNMAPSGLTFGRHGRYYLVLNLGLLTSFFLDPPAFRAVVLHELAHLRNRDVDRTYFTLAAGVSFALTALLPYLVSLFVSEERGGNLVNVTLRVAALALLVYGTIVGILRARESYADVRASGWDGAGGALRRQLAGLAPLPAGRLHALTSLHPQPADRRRAVEDPRGLLGLGAWDAFATGVAAAIAYPGLSLLLGLLLTGSGQSYLAQVVAGLVVGAPAAGVLALGTWRRSLAALDGAHAVRWEGTRQAGALSVGLLIGMALSLSGYLNDSSVVVSPLSLVGTDLLWGALLFGSLLLYLRWVAAGARAWLAVAAQHPSPRPAFLAGLVPASVCFGLWLGALLLGHDFTLGLVALGGGVGAGLLALALLAAGSLLLLIQPWSVLVTLALWAVPLAAALWRGPALSPGAPPWAWLDPSSQPLAVGKQPNPVVALKLALRAGALWCAALLAARAVLRLVVPPSAYSSDFFYSMLVIGQFSAAVVAAVVIARLVARRADALPALHGLGALWVAGALMSAGIAAAFLLFGPKVAPAVLPSAPGIIINAGALLSLPFLRRAALRCPAEGTGVLLPSRS